MRGYQSQVLSLTQIRFPFPRHSLSPLQRLSLLVATRPLSIVNLGTLINQPQAQISMDLLWKPPFLLELSIIKAFSFFRFALLPSMSLGKGRTVYNVSVGNLLLDTQCSKFLCSFLHLRVKTFQHCDIMKWWFLLVSGFGDQQQKTLRCTESHFDLHSKFKIVEGAVYSPISELLQ